MSLLLAGSLCLLPFLLPYHQLPILSFHAEWLAAALGVAAVLAASMNRRDAGLVAVPLPARWLIAFALFLAIQALAGNANYPQLPLLGALYVLYAAMLFWLGTQLAESAGLERAATVLATCLLVGALANAAAGIIQFYGRPALLQDFVAELRGGSRAYGNIGQANLYANYLALGGTALLYLWQRRKLSGACALAAGLLLAWAGALSGSRSGLLYAAWIAALALLAPRMPGGESRRLAFAAYGLAGAMLVAQLALPWLNDALGLGPPSVGAFDRLAEMANEHGELRWEAWPLALRVFADAPIAGVGIGEIAGAMFGLEFSAQMASAGIWTSAHNLPLQLLAETGAVGAFFGLAGLVTWCWQAGHRYARAPQPVLWWIIAAAGIELIHSMLEYPLWNAHFLGVSALLMGLGTVARREAATGLRRTLAAAPCALLALVLAILLRDYLLLDATRASGTAQTLARPADSERDAAVMRRLALGLLAPTAELWIFLGAPLDRGDLAAKVAMSARVARHFPADAVIVRRAVFLAFDGQAAEARRLLVQALRIYPDRCQAGVSILQQALAADPGAIAPLLALARHAGTAGCI